jgi:membrane associated rhomboid family serine protease
MLGLSGEAGAHRVPARPLLATLTDVRFLMFLVVWLGLNMLFGLGTVSMGGQDGEAIAWQAHIGGFFAGLILFNAFDPAVPQAEPNPEPRNTEPTNSEPSG